MSTLRDVARLSGVSPATVSNVLNNRLRNTTPQTRQRVLDAIKQLGYKPGAIPPGGQRQLSARTIGLVMWLAHYSPLSEYPYALALLDGILTAALPNHYNVAILSVEHWEDARAQVRLYADGRCDGFLLIAPPANKISEALRERGYPFVTVSTGDDDPSVYSVGIDDVAAARDLTAYIIGKGHRRIAYLLGDEIMRDTAQRVKGYKLAFAEARLAVDDALLIRPGSYDVHEAMATLGAFVERILKINESDRPTALMCGNDQLAHHAVKLLRERGLRVPNDISVAGFDGTRYAYEADPPIATIVQPLSKMGMEACSLLLSQIHGSDEPNRIPPARKVFEYDLFEGASILDLNQ